MTAAAGVLPPVGTRLDEREVGPFDAKAVAVYAATSGDDNPLHTDRDLAAQAGFASPPIHGMLLAAAFEPALRAWRDDLRLVRLMAKFVQPLLTGEAARISGRVVRHEGAGVLMRLVAQGPARAPSIIAEALLVPKSDPGQGS